MSFDPNTSTPNEYADCYRDVLGPNVIPSNGKVPNIGKWQPFQDKPIPPELHKHWKYVDDFRNGIQAIAGRVWHNPERTHLYFWAIDIDNELGIKEILAGFEVASLDQLIQKHNVLASQHENTKNKIHIYGYSDREIKRKRLKSYDRNNPQIPVIEIFDSKTVITLPPSPYDDGSSRAFIGRQPHELKPEPLDADKLDSILLTIYSKYGLLADQQNNTNNDDTDSINGNSEEIIQALIEQGKTIEESNRNNTIFELARKIRAKNRSGLSEDQLKALLWEFNEKCCKPPLPYKEFSNTWESSKKYVTGESRDSHEQKFDDLIGNVFYKIGEKPPKYIIAYKQTNHLIEAIAKSKDIMVNGSEVKKYYLYHNKTYLTCIPTKITRHKSPLTFLELIPKYTISFIDVAGETNILKHKTLSEILSNLRELGYVMGDGAEGALGAMVQAWKETKLIEDNEEMDYVGFFTDKDNKIIASNIEIKEPDLSKLSDDLLFLEELKPHFENRLDLLSTSIVWGVVAPAMFMLKQSNYFLKWLHFYGFPNATKSNTGKIILAIDGHHNDTDYLLNFSRIDTVARLGDAVSHTTFPKLVDEVDLSNPIYGVVINAIKSCIESTIARGKFLNSKAGSATPIPALSPLILTSNPPPPFHEAGYMRRIIERNFPQSESWKEDDSKALEFKEFLRLNLDRLKALGDFRNWYIINNQDTILDEKRLPSLDLGLKLLEAAYQAVDRDREMPLWLKLRLPENQLEESFEDNAAIVKDAFEKYIDERVNNNIQYWKAKDKEPDFMFLTYGITGRLFELAKSKLVPSIRIVNVDDLVIGVGILRELYNRGVTRDQCPNLRALADYMKATFTKSHGNKVVIVTRGQIYEYFDQKEKIQ